jgi:hypothetical protein
MFSSRRYEQLLVQDPDPDPTDPDSSTASNPSFPAELQLRYSFSTYPANPNSADPIARTAGNPSFSALVYDSVSVRSVS